MLLFCLVRIKQFVNRAPRLHDNKTEEPLSPEESGLKFTRRTPLVQHDVLYLE